MLHSVAASVTAVVLKPRCLVPGDRVAVVAPAGPLDLDPGDPGQETPAAYGFTAPRAVPNPFNPGAEIMFSVPTPGTVTVRLYDAAGRFVAELLRQDLAAGEHAARWNGRDATGRAAPSGVYLVLVTGPDGQRTGKITLSK